MIIQQYEMFRLHLDSKNKVDVNSITKSIDNIFYIKMFLMFCFGYIGRHDVLEFIEKMKTTYKDGLSFEDCDISIDNEDNLVYFSESYHTYDNKPQTPEIEQLLAEDNFIQLCKMGFLDYIVMTKQNFIHLLLIWAKTLNSLSAFALLYEDENNWFDVLPFDSLESMEKFIADHTDNSQHNIKAVESNSIKKITAAINYTKILTIIVVAILFLARLMIFKK